MPTPTSPPPLYSNPEPENAPSSPRQSLPRRRTRSKSILDELLPLPSATPISFGSTRTADILPYPIVRRIVSVGVVGIFLVVIVFLASTAGPVSPAAKGLRTIFGYGAQAELGAGWVAEETTGEYAGGNVHGGKGGEEEDVNKIDFDKYIMLRTLSADRLPLDEPGRRVIFIGDVHGSYEPLLRLIDQLSYDNFRDSLIHVGDLIAKGSEHNQVLDWMRVNQVQGVRGNHDQPVIQWRTWMEWAGKAGNWETYVAGLDQEDDEGLVSTLKKQDRMYPEDWEWKGEHWKIARELTADNYEYLLSLPLVIQMPSLHSFVVHAGLLPFNTLLAASDPSQPLMSAASNLTSYAALSPAEIAQLREDEELALLRDIPLNQAPWTLLNMRSIYTKGKHKGQPTKSGKKGTPWSEVWNKQMERCTGPGALEGADEDLVQLIGEEDVEAEQDEAAEVDETVDRRMRPEAVGARRATSKIPCAPVSVIYGHAAGRGLDIKPYSKGIDTGCVYGRYLTALVLGDTSGLQGEPITLAGHQGLLVSVSCEKGGW